jgi:predicted Zn-dependent protease
VAHVVLRHGLASIKRAQRAKALGVLLSETARTNDRWGVYAEAFGDMARAITVHILEKGWTRDQEWDADSLAFVYLSRAGYDPGGLIRLLKHLQGGREVRNGTPTFLRTHPDLSARIQRLQSWNIPHAPADSLVKVREQRFTRYVHASGR